MTENKSFARKLWSHMWIVSFAAIAIYLISNGTPNGDTYFLAATGKFIAENGYVPTTNPFVIHEGFGMIVQQWLFDVLIYGIYGPFGNWGLMIFEAIMCVVMMTLLNKYIALFTDNSLVRKIVLYAGGFFFLSLAIARPTIITIPLFIIMLILVEKYSRTKAWKYIIPLPFLALLQINIHSSMWPMMFIMLMPYVFPVEVFAKGSFKEQIKDWFADRKRILLIMLFMFVVGFLNPNGVNGMLYVFKSYGTATSKIQIIELASPAMDSFIAIFSFITIAAFAVYCMIARNKYRAGEWTAQNIFAKISMYLGVLFLVCKHQRNIWYLVLGAIPVLTIALTKIADEGFFIFKKNQKQDLNTWLKKITLAVGATFVVSVIVLSMVGFSENTAYDGEMAPIEAADYLDTKNKEDIKLFTVFNNGAYMEWRGYQVYIDARPELFHPSINGKKDIYSEYAQVCNGDIDYQEFLDKYNFTHLIVIDNSRLDVHMRQNAEYKVVIDGNGYKLYERCK